MQRPPWILACLVSLVALAGCGDDDPASVTERRTQTVTVSDAQTVTVRADGTPFHPASDTAWPAGSPLTAAGAARIVEGLAGAVGQASPRVRWVSISENYVSVVVLDPERPQQTDSWTWRDGAWSGPQPLANGDPEELAAEAFTPTSSQMAALDTILGRVARLSTDIEDAALSYLLLERDRRFDDRLVWRVSVDGTREDVTLYFSLDGSPLREP